jgi:glycosyltransferase involved in cell wall biosynthesis
VKILIIGEYSGVSKNLKCGFSKLGHHATIFTEGDGWKKIKSDDTDVFLGYRGNNYKLMGENIRGTWRLRGFFQFLKLKNKLKKSVNIYDFVIIINYEFLKLSFLELTPKFSYSDIRKVSKKGAPIFVLACGDDLPYLSEGKKMRYYLHNKMDVSNNKYFKKNYINLFDSLSDNITSIIPGMYDYAFAYRNFSRAKNLIIEKTIPFALDSSKIKPYNEIKNDTIKIFHGINQLNWLKGTPIIIKALDIIKTKYKSKVDIIIKESMPFNEYFKVMKETNIIIDQCQSYSYGMNAVYGMALGKVVFSGNEKECMEEFERNDIPIINILPEVNDIVFKLEKFINNTHLIKDYSEKSSNFARDFHNDKKVARKFLNLAETYIK